ncbi:MAG: HIT domain-containing protein [Planctomycetota bacterium]
MPENSPQNTDKPIGPDALWAPWRLQYLESIDDNDTPPPKDEPPAGPKKVYASFLAEYWANPDDDEKNHVLVRDAEGMVLMNRYPYANGHLLVALGEPRPRLLDYREAQRERFWSLVQIAFDLVETTLAPQGVNMGINQGRAAGAGIPQHLHAHVLPRWGGDVNFITTIGQIRVVPGALDAMADRFRAALRRVELPEGATPR